MLNDITFTEYDLFSFVKRIEKYLHMGYITKNCLVREGGISLCPAYTAIMARPGTSAPQFPLSPNIYTYEYPNAA